MSPQNNNQLHNKAIIMVTKNNNEARQKYLKEMSDYYANNSNSAALSCNETTRHLTNMLMTASLAYIGIATGIFSSSDSLFTVSCYERVLISVSFVAFVASVVFGVIEALTSIKLFKNAATKNMDVSNAIMEAMTDEDKDEDIKNKIATLQEPKNVEAGTLWLRLQIGAFLLGTAITLVYVLALLL